MSDRLRISVDGDYLMIALGRVAYVFAGPQRLRPGSACR